MDVVAVVVHWTAENNANPFAESMHLKNWVAGSEGVSDWPSISPPLVYPWPRWTEVAALF